MAGGDTRETCLRLSLSRFQGCRIAPSRKAASRASMVSPLVHRGAWVIHFFTTVAAKNCDFTLTAP